MLWKHSLFLQCRSASVIDAEERLDCTMRTIAALKTTDGYHTVRSQEADWHGWILEWNDCYLTNKSWSWIFHEDTCAVYLVSAWQLVCTLPWQTVIGIWCSFESSIMAWRRSPGSSEPYLVIKKSSTCQNSAIWTADLSSTSSADTSSTNAVLVTACLHSFKHFVCCPSHLLIVNADFLAWTWMTQQCAISCQLTHCQHCCSIRLMDHCQTLLIQPHMWKSG